MTGKLLTQTLKPEINKGSQTSTISYKPNVYDTSDSSSHTVLNTDSTLALSDPEDTLNTLDLVLEKPVVSNSKTLTTNVCSETEQFVKIIEPNNTLEVPNLNRDLIFEGSERSFPSKTFESKDLFENRYPNILNTHSSSRTVNSNIIKTCFTESKREEQDRKLKHEIPYLQGRYLNEKYIDEKNAIILDHGINSHDIRGSSTIVHDEFIMRYVAGVRSNEIEHKMTDRQSWQCFAWNLVALFYI